MSDLVERLRGHDYSDGDYDKDMQQAADRIEELEKKVARMFHNDTHVHDFVAVQTEQKYCWKCGKAEIK